jgi:hypothetical protein
VKLTKDQKPLEDIKPGELNQPIDVPQVWFQKFSFLVFGFLFLFLECYALFRKWSFNVCNL